MGSRQRAYRENVNDGGMKKTSRLSRTDPRTNPVLKVGGERGAAVRGRRGRRAENQGEFSQQIAGFTTESSI